MSVFQDFLRKFSKTSLIGSFNFLLFNFITEILSFWKVNYLLSSFIAYGSVVITASLGNVFYIFKRDNTYTHKIYPIMLTFLVYVSAWILEMFAIYVLVSKMNFNIFISKQAVYLLGGLYCFLLNMYFVFPRKNK